MDCLKSLTSHEARGLWTGKTVKILPKCLCKVIIANSNVLLLTSKKVNVQIWFGARIYTPECNQFP